MYRYVYLEEYKIHLFAPDSVLVCLGVRFPWGCGFSPVPFLLLFASSHPRITGACHVTAGFVWGDDSTSEQPQQYRTLHTVASLCLLFLLSGRECFMSDERRNSCCCTLPDGNHKTKEMHTGTLGVYRYGAVYPRVRYIMHVHAGIVYGHWRFDVALKFFCYSVW